MRFPRRFFVAGAVLAMLGTIASTLTAVAAEQPTTTPAASTPISGSTRLIHGTVTSIPSDTTFVVQTRHHGDLTVSVPSGGLKLPDALARIKRVKAHLVRTVKDLAVGDSVVVRGRLGSDGKTFEARRIYMLHHARAKHVNGTFVSFSGNTLTLKVGDANRSFTTTSTTVIAPKGTTLGSLTGTPTITVSTRGGTTALAVRVHASST